MSKHPKPSPQVVRATREDLENAQRWLAARGIAGAENIGPHYFSSTTFCVPGVAVQNLLLTDSTTAFLFGMIANPATSKGERNAALDAVVQAAITEARDADTKLLCTFVDNPKVEERLVRNGFAVAGRGLSFLALNLDKED